MTWPEILIAAGLAVLLVVLVLVDRADSRKVQPGVPAEQPDRRPR